MCLQDILITNVFKCKKKMTIVYIDKLIILVCFDLVSHGSEFDLSTSSCLALQYKIKLTFLVSYVV